MMDCEACNGHVGRAKSQQRCGRSRNGGSGGNHGGEAAMEGAASSEARHDLERERGTAELRRKKKQARVPGAKQGVGGCAESAASTPFKGASPWKRGRLRLQRRWWAS